METASAVERTANDAPQDEQRTSTTCSLGCWVKEFPPLKGLRLARDAHTHTNDPAFVLFRKPADGSRRTRLWASHRNEIEVGGWTGCVLAATTAAASSAILGCEQTKAKGVRSWMS